MVVPVFTNHRNPKGILLSGKKGGKQEPHSAVALQQVRLEAAHEWLHQTPSWGLHLASQHQAAGALSCALSVLHLYSVHPLKMCCEVSEKPERGCFWGLGMFRIFFPCKISVITSLLYAIWD